MTLLSLLFGVVLGSWQNNKYNKNNNKNGENYHWNLPEGRALQSQLTWCCVVIHVFTLFTGVREAVDRIIFPSIELIITQEQNEWESYYLTTGTTLFLVATTSESNSVRGCHIWGGGEYGGPNPIKGLSSLTHHHWNRNAQWKDQDIWEYQPSGEGGTRSQL